jgi:membrane protein required for colicin V production
VNWADYVVIAALTLSVLMGLWRGLIGEVLALAVWIVAVWVAWTIGPQVAASLSAVSLPSARIVLGYALCFVAVLIAGAILGFFLRKLIAGSGLSGTDRLLGAVFGLARGLALVTLTVLLLGFTPFPRDPWWHESRLLPSFQQAAQWASAHMPDEVTKYLDLRGLLSLPPPPNEDKKPAPDEHKT